jgi:hypothetical protein
MRKVYTKPNSAQRYYVMKGFKLFKSAMKKAFLADASCGLHGTSTQ